MNLLELKNYVDRVIEGAEQYGQKPEDIIVSIQIDDIQSGMLRSVWADGVKLSFYVGGGSNTHFRFEASFPL
jgi:hypothetical protein